MVVTPIISPYGSWKSPITAELVAGAEVGLEQVRLDGDDIYWIERRAHEGGRKVIVRRSSDGRVTDITPAGFNARTRVHEYGGGDYAVLNGRVIFSNFTDQRLYLQELGSEPKPLTPQAAQRYTDGQFDRSRNSFVCVREDHSGPGEAVNSIVRVDLNGSDDGTTIISGNDFYSSPRLSPDGSRLAWLTWNHPNMPWDGTELWVGKLSKDGVVTEKEKIAGGNDESIFQPEWSPDGILYFISDRTGWWNLYRWRENQVEPLCTMEAEFGQPQWVFGTSLYGFASSRRRTLRGFHRRVGDRDNFDYLVGFGNRQTGSITPSARIGRRCGIHRAAASHRVSHRTRIDRSRIFLFATKSRLLRANE